VFPLINRNNRQIMLEKGRQAIAARTCIRIRIGIASESMHQISRCFSVTFYVSHGSESIVRSCLVNILYAFSCFASTPCNFSHLVRLVCGSGDHNVERWQQTACVGLPKRNEFYGTLLMPLRTPLPLFGGKKC